jgi:ankyrin repeat protein
VNAVDGVQKWTPLHLAARDGNDEIVEVLLNAGASVDAVNISGNTPLWENIMAPTRDTKTIQTLLQHGADAWKKNKRGDAPIDVARHMGRNDLWVFQSPCALIAYAGSAPARPRGVSPNLWLIPTEPEYTRRSGAF